MDTDFNIPGVSFHDRGEGLLGPLIRKRDWGHTSLGPIENWPLCLKAYVSMILSLPTPAIIFWGSDKVQIYNDGYATIMGPKHPTYQGSTFQECWTDTYSLNNPWMERVLRTGEVVTVDKTLIPVSRYGFEEEAYFSFTFSPLKDEEGKISGLLQLVSEVTAAVILQRRQEFIRRLASLSKK